jgi:NAD(P)-dependent dehydrogenase (short-subunit alcohol dehydrogenase family)
MRLFGRRRYSVAGKVVLVTGGSRGLGLCLARELVKRGAKVAITARDPEELGHVADELGDVLTVPCDLADASQIVDMVHEVEAEAGPIDVLINNAGIMQVGPLETMTLDNYEYAMKIHLWAPLQLIDAVLPQMRERHSGRIVNISSVGGRIAVPHMLPYSVSKFALVGLSRGLRVELRKDDILVTTVCPGLMRTGSARHVTFKGNHQLEFAWFASAAALPILSIEVNRAARRIVNALE